MFSFIDVIRDIDLNETDKNERTSMEEILMEREF